MSSPAGFDPESGEHTEGEFKRQGIKMHPDFSPVKVVKGKDGKLTMTAKNNDDKEITVEGLDHILMATGRKPSTQGIFPDEVWPIFFFCVPFLVPLFSTHGQTDKDKSVTSHIADAQTEPCNQSLQLFRVLRGKWSCKKQKVKWDSNSRPPRYTPLIMTACY